MFDYLKRLQVWRLEDEEDRILVEIDQQMVILESTKMWQEERIGGEYMEIEDNSCCSCSTIILSYSAHGSRDPWGVWKWISCNQVINHAYFEIIEDRIKGV